MPAKKKTPKKNPAIKPYNPNYWENSPFKRDPVYQDTLKFGGDEKAAHDCARLYREGYLFSSTGYRAEVLNVPWDVWRQLRDKYTSRPLFNQKRR